MNHLSEQDLAEWERLVGERKAEIQEHVGMCEACRAAVEAHVRMLALLDESGAPEMRDQTEEVLALMMRERDVRRREWPVLAKMAAAIVLSGSVGYAAGLFSRPAVVAAKADLQQAARMLHLDELGVSATGELRELFMSDMLASAEETNG